MHRGQDRGVSRLAQTFFDDEKIQKFCFEAGTRNFSDSLHLFAGGNLEGRKGVHMAILALSKARARGIRFDYVYGGFGPERERLRSLSRRKM
jgi:hypothetical protein